MTDKKSENHETKKFPDSTMGGVELLVKKLIKLLKKGTIGGKPIAGFEISCPPDPHSFISYYDKADDDPRYMRLRVYEKDQDGYVSDCWNPGGFVYIRYDGKNWSFVDPK